MSDDSPHQHKFDKVFEQPTLVAKYRQEEGEIKYIATTGKDILKMRKCKCGATETYDLERTIVT